MDVDELLKSLENDNNESIMDLTTDKINEQKYNILMELGLTDDEIIDLYKKLVHYRYCNDMKDINYGCFLRWIPLNDPDNLKLSRGGMLCDIKITDTGLLLLCKNYRNHFFHVKFDEVLLFQKITNQERVILDVLNFLEKDK